MADQAVEAAFVSAFWGFAARGKEDYALRIADGISPEVFEDHAIGRIYEVLSDRLAVGECRDDPPTTSAALKAAGAERDLALQISGDALYSERTPHRDYARKILTSWRARRQAQLLSDAASKSRDLARVKPDEASDYGARVASSLLLLQKENRSALPEEPEPIADAELAAMDAGGVRGISWPFPKMERHIGTILPGQVIGLSGYPGNGKSTAAANIWRGLQRRGIPCILVPTEMGTGWIRRAWAAEARVPQEIAEGQQWGKADAEMYAAYRRVITASREDRNWVMINRPRLTPSDVMARASILRRRWPGEQVLVILDHMHDLTYRDGETDRHVGAALQAIRKMAQDDDQGGMSVLALLQPRKPPEDTAIYKPIRAHQVRGQVHQILDAHISVFRWSVKTHPHDRTPWGTRRAIVGENGRPEMGKPDAPDTKADDERMYFKADKRRIGGEGPTFWLDFEAPSGRLSETRMMEAMSA